MFVIKVTKFTPFLLRDYKIDMRLAIIIANSFLWNKIKLRNSYLQCITFKSFN